MKLQAPPAPQDYFKKKNRSMLPIINDGQNAVIQVEPQRYVQQNSRNNDINFKPGILR